MTSRAILRAAVLTSFVAAACGESVQPEIPAFSATPSAQWSGGAITLRSSFFVDRVPLPLITTGTGDTLGLTRQDDSTVTTTLPPGPSGPVTLAMQTGSKSWALAGVQRVGFREMRTQTGPGFDGVLQASDSAGVPLVFGAVSTNLTGYRAPIVRLQPGSAQSSLLVPTLRQPDNVAYGMAPSVTPGVFAVRDTTDTLRMARLTDGPPVVLRTAAIRFTSTRQVAQLNDSIWLLTGSHYTLTYVARDTSVSMITNVASESPYRVFMSPRGDRTTLGTLVSGVEGGIPVFDNATGTLAYRLPFAAVYAAAFSPDGATLYVGGGRYVTDSLVAVDATTGAVLAGPVKLPDDFLATAIAYRTTDNQLLVGATSGANSIRTTLYLLVYRASTLELLGVLPSAYECGEFGAKAECFDGAITVHDAADRAYLVNTGSPIRIMTFDLLGNP
jgi:hypothetical protein